MTLFAFAWLADENITHDPDFGRLGVSAATASGHIKGRVDAGVLREWTGRKRDQVFMAPGILAFMHGRDDQSLSR